MPRLEDGWLRLQIDKMLFSHCFAHSFVIRVGLIERSFYATLIMLAHTLPGMPLIIFASISATALFLCHARMPCRRQRHA